MAVKVGFVGTGGMAGAHMNTLKGFDDVEFDVPPPVALTTIRQPADEIAQQALIMLNNQIDQRAFSHRVILRPRLIARSSCTLNHPSNRRNTETEEISS